MRRRDFLKNSVAVAVAAELGTGQAQGKVPAHDWGSYDFGSGPTVNDRLNQGPFPQYPPDAVIPTDDVVMTTTPSEDVVANYGKGLVTYVTADSGTEEIKSDNIPLAIEELVPGNAVLRDVRLHALGRLVHRHRNANELDLAPVFLVHRLEMRLELTAVRAPRRPELDEHWLLSDVLREIDLLAVERLDGRTGRSCPDLDPTILRLRVPHRREPQRR